MSSLPLKKHNCNFGPRSPYWHQLLIGLPFLINRLYLLFCEKLYKLKTPLRVNTASIFTCFDHVDLKGYVLSGANLAPFGAKKLNRFSQISFDWFIRRMTEV